MMITYRLKELLEQRHMSSRELSRRSGVSTSTISAIRQNKAQLLDRGTLARLCETLECTPGDLIVYTPTDVEALHRARKAPQPAPPA